MYNYTESIGTFFLYKEIETAEPTRPAFKAKFVISSRLRVRLESKVGDAKRMLSPTVDLLPSYKIIRCVIFGGSFAVPIIV